MKKLALKSKEFYFKVFENEKIIYNNKEYNIYDFVKLYENEEIEENIFSQILLKKSQEDLDKAFKKLGQTTGVYTIKEIKENMQKHLKDNDVIIYLEKKYEEYIDEKLLKETIDNLQKLGFKKIAIVDGQELFPTHRPELGYINIYIKDPNDINNPFVIKSNYITNINFEELKNKLNDILKN